MQGGDRWPPFWWRGGTRKGAQHSTPPLPVAPQGPGHSAVAPGTRSTPTAAGSPEPATTSRDLRPPPRVQSSNRQVAATRGAIAASRAHPRGLAGNPCTAWLVLTRLPHGSLLLPGGPLLQLGPVAQPATARGSHGGEPWGAGGVQPVVCGGRPGPRRRAERPRGSHLFPALRPAPEPHPLQGGCYCPQPVEQGAEQAAGSSPLQQARRGSATALWLTAPPAASSSAHPPPGSPCRSGSMWRGTAPRCLARSSILL